MEINSGPNPPTLGSKKPNLVYFLAILSAWQRDSVHTTAVLTEEQPPRAMVSSPKNA